MTDPTDRTGPRTGFRFPSVEEREEIRRTERVDSAALDELMALAADADDDDKFEGGDHE